MKVVKTDGSGLTAAQRSFCLTEIRAEERNHISSVWGSKGRKAITKAPNWIALAYFIYVNIAQGIESLALKYLTRRATLRK